MPELEFSVHGAMPFSHVIKVGGSLYDLPDLGEKLWRWLATLSPSACLLIPGGGHAADWIRAVDGRHRLGEERAHWLALRSLTLNAHVLVSILGEAAVVVDEGTAAVAHQRGLVPVLDPFEFARADERSEDHLPHCWNATSDAVAWRVALVMKAKELVFLKSVTIPEPFDAARAARQGWIDEYCGSAPAPPFRLRTVNLKEWRDH